MSTSQTPASCPSCRAEQIGSYPYCTSCGVYWASLTSEAKARKAAHAADMRAKFASQSRHEAATIKRLLAQKNG